MEDTGPGGCSLLPCVIKHFSMSYQRLPSLPPLPAGRRKWGNSNEKDGGALRRLRSWTITHPHVDSVYSLVAEKSESLKNVYQTDHIKTQEWFNPATARTHTSGSANFCLKPKHIIRSTWTCWDPSFKTRKKKKKNFITQKVICNMKPFLKQKLTTAPWILHTVCERISEQKRC